MTYLAELTAKVRRCALVPLLLRLIIALALTGAIVATAVPAWDVPDAYLWIAVIAGGAGAVIPDAGGAAIASGAVVVAWAVGAPDGVGPAVVVTALCLLVVHVASALAAAMPVTAAAAEGALRRWLRPTGVLGGGTVAVAVAAGVLNRWSPPGSVVLVLLAVAVLSAGVWWATST
jgi:hypothetical protein